jgi:beta-mannosidase
MTEMKTIHDLGTLKWTLSGWTPDLWRLMQTAEIGALPTAEIRGVPAPVPGSVQKALRDADILPDWNITGNPYACEWVENRHWIYETTLPDQWLQAGNTYRLNCLGLDYSGWIFLNGKEIGAFRGSHIPHVFDLTPHLNPSDNHLRIVFDLPPRWLGQFGFTSKIRDWKARFNYTWDWQPRFVQTGIWDKLFLEAVKGAEITNVRVVADADMTDSTGCLNVQGGIMNSTKGKVCIALQRDEQTIREKTFEVSNAFGILWEHLPVELWYPNGEGEQPLYTLRVTLTDKQGEVQDSVTRQVGFRHIEWKSCEDAPLEADPWLCVVNGKPIFLQGVNCPPLLPNFADTPDELYEQRFGRQHAAGQRRRLPRKGALL